MQEVYKQNVILKAEQRCLVSMIREKRGDHDKMIEEYEDKIKKYTFNQFAYRFEEMETRPRRTLK